MNDKQVYIGLYIVWALIVAALIYLMMVLVRG